MKKIITVITALAFFQFSFSQGFYMEMKITYNGGKESGGGNMKMFYQNGNSRTETQVSIPGMAGGMNLATLHLKEKNDVIYSLNVASKTYSEINTGSDEEYRDRPQGDYEITILGTEKVANWSCTHVRIKEKGSKNQGMEWWVTKDLSNYADYSKIKSKYTGKNNLFAALKAKGVEGYPVRIKTSEQGNNMTIEVIKAEQKNNPASLFSLSGYTKSRGMDAGNMQEMMQNIQNMTPEEREKWMKQMQEQYGNH